jgi:hypothetical protein
MVWFLISVAVVAAVAGGAALYAARHIGRRAAADNEVVPGSGVEVPDHWFGSHDPEPRLHRRLRDAMRSVTSVADGEPLLAGPMVTAREHAIDLDRRLVACALLPGPTRGRTREALEQAVASFEELAGSIVASATSSPTIDEPTASGELDRLAAQLALLDGLRYEAEPGDPAQGAADG